MLDFSEGKIEFNDNYNSEEKVDILFAGDFCTRYKTEEMIIAGESENILQPIKESLKNKDLSVINLEGPLLNFNSPIPKSGPNIKMDPKCINFLKAGGFDIANLANNHIGDHGTEGVLATIDTVENNNIRTVGAGENLKDSSKPISIIKNGIKISFLSFAENEFGMAEDNKPGASPLNPLKNIEDIKNTSDNSDITIVLVHGGNEQNPIPSPRMKQRYHSFIDAGATAVIGTHTHCPQGIEIYNESPIVYSLGNFLFDRNKINNRADDSMWWKSYMLRVSFSKDNAFALEVIPYNFGPAAEEINLLKGQDKIEFMDYLNFLSEVIKDKKELNRFWRGWAAMNGPDWLNFLQQIEYPFNKDDKEVNAKIPAARNVLNCEAHNELLTTFMNLVYRDEVETAAKYIPKINKLRKGQIPKS
jgi:poly-gamma-glutamate synthesis protein (capsule biosynthesis protein)